VQRQGALAGSLLCGCTKKHEYQLQNLEMVSSFHRYLTGRNWTPMTRTAGRVCEYTDYLESYLRENLLIETH